MTDSIFKVPVTIEKKRGRMVKRVCIGYMIGTVFYKDVEKSKHLFRKTDAWGIDGDRFVQVIKFASKIVIFDKEERIRYECTPKDYEEHGQYMTFMEHRPQIFLPRKHFTETKK